MAIIQRKQNFDDRIEVDERKEGIVGSEKTVKEQLKDEKDYKKRKKQGFLKTTISELKKVDWPNFGYTLKWSGVVLLFTIVLSLLMGLFDKVFADSMTYVNCRVDTAASTCSTQLMNNLTFKN